MTMLDNDGLSDHQLQSKMNDFSGKQRNSLPNLTQKLRLTNSSGVIRPCSRNLLSLRTGVSCSATDNVVCLILLTKLSIFFHFHLENVSECVLI